MDPRLRLVPVCMLLALVSAAAPSAKAAATKAQGRHFASPEEAVTALVTAAKEGDEKKMLGIFGTAGKPLISSGDPVADRAAFERFVTWFEESNRLTHPSDTQAILEVGKEDWPFPIPLVKDKTGWRFDTAAGKDEMLNRRIGNNELSAIQACLAYVDAQREYYLRDPDGDSLLHYARHLRSTNGKRDGLYWPTTGDEPESPLGPFFAQARAEGYSTGGPSPYHGYLFRILDEQGPHADGGAYSYLAKGELMGGFAMVAYPAKYAASGVMTFLVNHDGVVFEKDLGPHTTELARKMKRFDPDETWKRMSAAEAVPPEGDSRGV
jgi:Protein of unknown function (DUF2950)